MKRPKFIPEFADIPRQRTKMPELAVDQRRLNFSEVELGFTEELAKQEAARCLSCRRCIGCGLCLAECDPCAIVYDEQPSEIVIQADAVVFAAEAGQFEPSRKRDLGYGECWNVVTNSELERLLSPTGPFGGLLVRPSDGEIPAKIGFIQCVGSRDEAIGANYCSSECCSRTIAQALRAKELVGQVQVHVFHRGMRPAGKTSEAQLKSIEGQPWVSLVEAAVTSVKEDPASGTVTVRYASGGAEAEATFDLVVLAVGIQARRDFRRLARAGGVGVNRYGFVDPGITNMIACKEGVAFAGTIRGPQSPGQAVVDAMAGASKALASLAAHGAGPQPDRVAQLAGEPTGVQARGGGRPAVFRCRYGMALAGEGAAVADDEEAGALALDGSFPFLCHMSGLEAMAKQADSARGLVVVGCHAGIHEEMFEHLLALPSGAVKIVGAAEINRDGAAAIEGALDDLQSGGGGARSAQASGGAGELGATGDAVTTESSTEVLGGRGAAVLGGGVAGLAAASELLRRKVKTVIVEESQVLGGGFSRLGLTQAADLRMVEDFVKAIEHHRDACVVKCAQVRSVTKDKGGINLTVSSGESERRLTVGALVVAVGGGSHVAKDFPAGTDLVMTQDALAASLAAGRAQWKRIVMIQCVGSRDAEHPYCSRFCCRQALTNARLLKKAQPDVQVTVLHKGVRVFGFDEDLLTDAVEQGVSLVEIRDRPSVEAGRPLRVRGVSAAGQALSLECDALVLAVGHTAGEAAARIAGMTGTLLDGLGFFEVRNPLIRPFATTAPGVFVCGSARVPVTVDEAFADGLGAAQAVCEYLQT